MKLRLDGHSAVTAAELEAVARGAAEVTPGPDARAWLKRSRDVLEACVASGARIYGVTTGDGPLATTHVGPELSRQLQTNLVYHLATGVGPLLSAPQARASTAASLSPRSCTSASPSAETSCSSSRRPRVAADGR